MNKDFIRFCRRQACSWHKMPEYTLAANIIDKLVTEITQKTPCDFCSFNPPSSLDGKPCCYCPAESIREESQQTDE